jgi:bifunctional non-homologous end joining protein LigD
MKTARERRLGRYQAKRDFRRTPEPAGHVRARKGFSFVVQEHHASRLHYDFRLELEGVLKSWAVPKGPSLDPAVKRLAVHVEDHPIDYGRFEGVIPEGEYGAGRVVLWDRGTWVPVGDPREGYRRGHLKFRLEGAKLRGGWDLIQMQGRGPGPGDKNWLLVKERDEDARAEDRTEERPAAETVLTNPDRVLYPDRGITKRDVARYYESIADWILPHVAGRPLSLVRCPEGQGRACFYQKHATKQIPETIRRIRIPEGRGTVGTYLYIDGLPALIALVQMGVLELHPWGSRVDSLERPDRMTLDLDPGPGVPWTRMTEAAAALRERLKGLGLESFVKTTGGKGLHVVAPLAARHSWDEVREFSRAIAEGFVRESPREFVATMTKSKRAGKIFLDYLRNARGATTVAAYSTRARPGAPVATPLAWDELPRLGGGDAFTIETLPSRLERGRADPWKGFFDLRPSITASMRRSVGLAGRRNPP